MFSDIVGAIVKHMEKKETNSLSIIVTIQIEQNGMHNNHWQNVVGVRGNRDVFEVEQC